MSDDTRHQWNPDPEKPKLTKCGLAVEDGMKMTDDPNHSDCAGCKK